MLIETDSTFKILHSQKFNFKIKIASHGRRSKGFLFWENIYGRSPRTFYLSYPFTITSIKEEELPVHDSSAIDFIMDTEIDSIIWRQGKLFDKNKTLITDFIEKGFKDLSGNLRAVYQEKDNEMWIGNNFGLYKIIINKNKFKNYFTIPQFNEDNQNSFRGLLVFNDRLYANNEAKGMCTNYLATDRTTCSNEKNFGGFTCIEADGKGNLLQGCFYGLNKINTLNGTATPLRISKKGVRVWCLCKFENENYIAGTEEGLIFFDNKNNSFIPFEKYNQFSQLKTAFIISITKDKTNTIYWICSNAGLFTLDLQKGITACYSSTQKEPYFLPADNFHAVHEDASENLWIASAQGLIKWERKNGNKKIFTRADGLSDNTIYALHEDKRNNLWLSSDYGLMCLNTKTLKVKTYLTEDGISNNEFNRISHYENTNGFFYFGSLNGVTSFDPGDFTEDNSKLTAPFVISSFVQFDRDSGKLIDKTSELLNTREISVQPDDKLFTLDYVLLNYNYAEQNLYAYKIDGVNDDWVYSTEHSLSISSLPYGEHLLHIKVKAVNSLWSDQIDINIKVLKPFYLQAWFFILLVVLMFMIISAVFIIRTRQYRKTQLLLKTEVRKQTATILEQSLALKTSLQQKDTLLREIHHRVKNNLQVISGLLSLQSGDSENEELKAIMKEGRNRVKSMALIHQMLYQNENLNRINFQEYLEQLTKEISAGFKRDTEVNIKITAPEITFDVDTAIPLGLIINELVTNSLKYAFTDKGGLIEITIEKQEENTFKLTVRDSGKGLPEQFDLSKTKTLGLKLVKMLCTQLRAQVSFTSANGTQAEIIFKDTWKK
ncbi:MAG: hypothetical protein IAF38_05400 [Bacteroidia bacterium]|nr:hypothetical protein [Bacteroidia bacterium]